MKLSVANIVNILNHKYDATLWYSDIYQIVENLKRGLEKDPKKIPRTDF